MLWEESTREAMEALQKAGIEIIRLDQSKFAAAVEPLYEEYQRENPQLYQLAQDIKAVGNEAGKGSS